MIDSNIRIQIHISQKTFFWILFELISPIYYFTYCMYVSVSNKYCLNQLLLSNEPISIAARDFLNLSYFGCKVNIIL